MTQKLMHEGKPYEFPDDASLDEINSFFGNQLKSSLGLSSILPKQGIPGGMSIAAGLASVFMPGEKGELLKNLPQIALGQQPTLPEKALQTAGEFAVGMEGAPAVKAGAELGVQGVKKGLNYINPESISESLRGKFGEGTIAENLGELGQRISFGKQSAKGEALIPKEEFMQHAGGKQVTRINPLDVNIENVAKEFADDVSEFTPDRMKKLSKAINEYYKTGDMEAFAEKGGNIFGSTKEFTEKGLSKLESLMPIEKIQPSKYVSNAETTKFYSPKGELSNLHNKYVKTKSVEDADRLMSNLKTEIRDLKYTKEKHGLSDLAAEKLRVYEDNLSNLKQDFSKFVKSLPAEQRGKYSEFLKKYAINVGPYEDAGYVVNQLSKGNFEGISQSSIENLFSNANPSKEIRKIINDIGPSGWNNIVHNMLSKYAPGDVKGMANAIIEAKRKGSPIITDEMVGFAKHALKRSTISSAVKSSAAGAAGMMLGGPVGGVIGAASPYLWANKDLITKAFKGLRK